MTTRRNDSTEAAPAGRLHRTAVQLRFFDTDMFGHVNNAVYATWAEIARIAFMRGLQPPSGDLILASIDLSFEQQIRYGQDVEVLTGVGRIGRTSVTLDQTVRADGENAARIGSVVVLYDYAAQATRPVSDAYRAALEPYLVGP